MKIIIQLLLFLMISNNALQAEKYCLIIAIGDYPDDGGWPDISSQNDVFHVKTALQNLGFAENNIQVLRNKAATKKGIIKALEELRNKINKGDIIFIHFSGHGQQVFDDNQDEIDQLDEAIVPYDSPLFFEEGVYEGDLLIRDDYLGNITNEIREKTGKEGQVILVLDSCHSGSGTRGFGRARGTTNIMAPKNFQSKTNKGEKHISFLSSNQENLAPIASFFGASARELNYETIDDQDKPVGSLSYALYSTLANMKKQSTFEELFDRVKLKMKKIAPRQNPQWEGPKNATIFGKEFNPNDVLVNVKEYMTPNKLKIDAGTLLEIFEGSTIELISVDLSKTLTKGKVIKTSLNESVILLNKNIEFDDSELYKIKIINRTLPKVKCTLDNQISKKSVWLETAVKVEELSITKSIETNAELILSECEDGSTLQLLTYDGFILYEAELATAKKSKTNNDLKKAIMAYAQGKFIKSFETPSNPYKFDFSIVEVDADTGERIKTVNAKDAVSLPLGTNLKLEVKNTGKRAAYFSVLDIQPDYQLNLLLPAVDFGYTAEEYFLKPGESYLTDYAIEIAEPLGNETLKLVCSKEPLALANLIGSNGSSSRGFDELNPFEQVLSLSYDLESTRGAKIKRPNDATVGVFSIFFEITK